MDVLEEKKERCRLILEKAMRNLVEIHTMDGYSWFAWESFQEDLIAAMEELEVCARQL